MINFQAVGEVVYTGTTLVSMGNDYYLMASIDQFGGQLVDVTFDSSWLGKEEVTDHGDVVRHLDVFSEGLCLEGYMRSIMVSMNERTHVPQ